MVSLLLCTHVGTYDLIPDGDGESPPTTLLPSSRADRVTGKGQSWSLLGFL